MDHPSWLDHRIITHKLAESRVSTHIMLLLLALFIVITFSASLIINRLVIFTHDAFVINNVGIIRGSIQRVVKNHSLQQPMAPLISDINDTFSALENIFSHDYRLPDNFSRTEVLRRFTSLKSEWSKLQNLIEQQPGSDTSALLFSMSENCWDKANSLNFYLQTQSEIKHNNYETLLLFTFLITSAIVFIIFYIVYKLVHKNLEIDVITDPMTRLYNRAYFNQILHRHILFYERYQTPFSLVIYDIDHFKTVNDNYGHLKGDKVLIELSNLIKSNARDVDYLFRLGGEEFAVIAPQSTLDQAYSIAEKNRLIISENDFDLDQTVTISAGIAEYQAGEQSEELIARADRALYRAKTDGRNQVVKSAND